MSRPPHAVCVYCGSRTGGDGNWVETATALGEGLGRRGIALVYGGGSVGLMGATARGAMAAGGSVIGIIPRDLEARELGNRDVTELHVVGSMHERKLMMAQKSDAFVVLPGGLGTLDETFEILTWRQLRFHDKPIILADIDGYWQPFMDLLHHVTDRGFADPAHIELLTIADSVDGIFAAIDAMDIGDTSFAASKV